MKWMVSSRYHEIYHVILTILIMQVSIKKIILNHHFMARILQIKAHLLLLSINNVILTAHGSQICLTTSFLHIGTLGVGWGTRPLGWIIETVFHEGLRLSCTADNNDSTKQTKCCSNPTSIQGVSESHNGGFFMSGHWVPYGGHDCTQCYREEKRKDLG